ncbi:Monocarboxylate transport permease protein [Paraburkholderia ultramafica]|uniref:Monocarboxylate transport permease protein n=1 Tax=Paraburkholderia ultramafica TaxID=1544867 RepID=A0A6S7BQH9_9BURK|nr:sodium:solute symporter [Paraburkholderia ultramafica]CAB3809783.1 Monocarboxylate transport permease protein [Paraburkholderia ultramafica]
MNIISIAIFVALFALVSVLGMYASRWRQADLSEIQEWGLAGRRLGTVMSWFLIGGDLYTAYTFVAVPALVFAAGAMGFFAVPYTIMVFPLGYLVLPRLWRAARQHGHVTVADFIEQRFSDRPLALAIALTGILATLPYIALQLVGIQVTLGALGFPTHGWAGELPLFIAFGVLAIYTWSGGLRAPAMIAVVKDLLIYATIIGAIIVIPARLGGFAHMFAALPAPKLLLKAPDAASLNGYSSYSTLALGSAFALLLYPHSMTATLSASSDRVIRRNMALLPAYSLMLAFVALLGVMALSSGVAAMPEYAAQFRQYGPNFAVFALFLHFFPSWFVGVAFAAIGIGALVPAAIMSIAAANLFTRNVWRPLFARDCSAARETRMAKQASLFVKFGALGFVLLVPVQYAIQLQLLGGVWITQTLPAIVLGLFVPAIRARSLLAGWAAGLAAGTWMMAENGFKSAAFTLHFAGVAMPAYVAVIALLANLGVVLAWSVLTLKSSPEGIQSDFPL